MRRKLILLTKELLFGMTLFASDKESSAKGNSSFKFGIKGGVNVASLGNLNYESVSDLFSSYTGFSAGIATSFQLPVQGMTLQPELYYLSNGFKYLNEVVSVGYIHLPVNFQVGLDLILLRPFVMVSPFVSYALHKSEDNGWSFHNRFDYGIGVGGGIDFWRMQFQIKYNWSFAKGVTAPLLDDSAMKSENGTSEEIVGSNRNLEISLVFFF